VKVPKTVAVWREASRSYFARMSNGSGDANVTPRRESACATASEAGERM
jgi:hypothetical protein